MSGRRKENGTTEHRYAEERLSAYLDGELTAQERAAVERHVAGCQACQWNLETLRQTVQWTRELPSVPVPRVFTVPVPAKPMRAPRWRWTAPVLQGATVLAALLLFFVVAGDLVLTGTLPIGVSQRGARVEEAPADIASQKVEVEATRVVEAEVSTVVETVVVEMEAEALPEAAAVEATTPEPLPSPAPQQTLLVSEPPQAAGAVPTPTQEFSALTSPRFAVTEEVGEAADAEEGAEMRVEAPAEPPPEPVVTTATIIVPTPTPTPLPPLAPTMPLTEVSTESVPTEVAMVPREAPAEEGTQEWNALDPWFGLAEAVLLAVFVLLLVTTFVVVIRRRRAR
jgi:hypothetical protein